MKTPARFALVSKFFSDAKMSECEFGSFVRFEDWEEALASFPEWMGEEPRQNSPWNPQEEKILVESFKNGDPIDVVAKRHGRGHGSINSRLSQILNDNYYHKEMRSRKPEAIAEKLISQGYRRVSSKYKTISRIDRANWLEILAKKMNLAVADYYKPDGSLSSNWPDHYRRCMSDDKITVDEDVFKLIPSSSHDEVGYLPR